MRRYWLTVWLLGSTLIYAQTPAEDSLDNIRLAQMINLSEVVVSSNFNVSRFIVQVKKDTTFYKAFKNLRVLDFTSSNDILLRDKKGTPTARLISKTRQVREGGCRTMQVLEENTQGDFYNREGGYNYYTAELYAGLFFTKGKVCGETNVLRSSKLNPREQRGLAKHKEQLKMLLFNPGQKVPGIPLIGDKIDLFDPQRALLYDFSIDYADRNGESCYLFSIKAKENLRPGELDKIVVDKMDTWFSTKTMEVLARHYTMSYDAGVYDFNVQMEAEMTRFNGWLVPKVLRYVGDWDVVLKKRERGIFTATLYDFKQ
jgi:hypothetical protein